MPDPRDYKIDIRSINSGEAPVPRVARPYISVLFNCCQVYNRVYRNASGTAYEPRCPRCGRTMKIAIGPGGTLLRTFVVE